MFGEPFFPKIGIEPSERGEISLGRRPGAPNPFGPRYVGGGGFRRVSPLPEVDVPVQLTEYGIYELGSNSVVTVKCPPHFVVFISAPYKDGTTESCSVGVYDAGPASKPIKGVILRAAVAFIAQLPSGTPFMMKLWATAKPLVVGKLSNLSYDLRTKGDISRYV